MRNAITAKSMIKKVLPFLLIPLADYSYSQGDLGYRFIHNNVGIRDLAPAYGPYYTGAAGDFMTHTSLNFYWSSNQTLDPPYSGDVAFSEANYGATGWHGIAIGYNAASQACADPVTGFLTGNCTYANGADFAWIRFNTYYLPSPTSAERNNLIRHEFAHILGLGHSGCFPATGVMAPSISCSPLFTVLQPTEAGILGSWY